MAVTINNVMEAMAARPNMWPTGASYNAILNTNTNTNTNTKKLNKKQYTYKYKYKHKYKYKSSLG